MNDSKSQALFRWIAGELQSGKAPAEVERELISRGADAETANALVARIAAALENAPKPSVADRFGSHAIRWAAIIGVFLLANGALWVGQEVYHRDDVAQAHVIDAQLGALRTEIGRFDELLDMRARESDSIDALGARLDARTGYVSNGEYEQALARYNTEVDRWNAALPELTRLGERRDSVVEVFNNLVDKYNEVAQKAYSRWYLIPIPGGRRGSSHQTVH